VAQFCLGRFWRQASPQQQQRFVMLFHQVLMSNIMAKLGEYQGVKFTVSRSRRQEEDEIVSSVVERPNNPPTNVDWVISDPDSNPKISDILAAGTSFRLTQRSDYASYWRTTASRAATGRVRSRRFRSGLPPPRSAAIRCSARSCRAAPPVGPAVGIQRGSSRNHASCQLCKLRNGNRNHA
jgi:hypothetical protein